MDSDFDEDPPQPHQYPNELSDEEADHSIDADAIPNGHQANNADLEVESDRDGLGPATPNYDPFDTFPNGDDDDNSGGEQLNVEEKHDQAVKEDAASRLLALRADQELCDASITVKGQVFRIHLAIVGEISSVFKMALCGDFKESKEKNLELKSSSPKVVGVILDYAYGRPTSAKLSDFRLCMQVWKEAHMYQIDGLRRVAFGLALEKFWPHHMIEVMKYVKLYCTDEEIAQSISHFAEQFMDSSERCREFYGLSSGELLQALRSESLVGTEDELLDVLLEWVKRNPEAKEDEKEELFECIGLERLACTKRVEALCDSKMCPPSLLAQSSRLGFQRMQGEAAMETFCGSICLDRSSTKIFIRGRDSVAKNLTHFRYGNFAMSGHLFEIENLFLCLALHHRIRPGRGSFQRQAERTRLSAIVIETTGNQHGRMHKRYSSTIVDFTDARQFQAWVSLPISNVKMEARSFWCYLTKAGSGMSYNNDCLGDRCGECRKRKIPTRVF